jgi:cyclophilin family peptidyl-prolyl cis-trans isomerase
MKGIGGLLARGMRAATFIAVITPLPAAGATPVPGATQRRRGAEPVIVDMVIEKRGRIRLELLAAAAPRTVAHFLDLVDHRFYDGILFHRVEAHSVAQAGDPGSRKIDGSKIASISPTEAAQLYNLGVGGSGKTVPLEATVPCARGTLGLGRSISPDSGDSQFFFNLTENHRLDNQYTVFAKVVRGLDVMDTLRQGDRIKTIRRVGKSGRG